MSSEDPKIITKSELIDIYTKKILPTSLTGNKVENDSEIIDIISNYSWTVNPLKSGTVSNSSVSFQHNIPFCYIVERRQTVNSSIMNMLNTIKGTLDIARDTLNKATAGFGDAINSFMNIGNAAGQILSGNLQIAGQNSGTAQAPAQQTQSISLDNNEIMPLDLVQSGSAAESPSSPSDKTTSAKPATTSGTTQTTTTTKSSSSSSVAESYAARFSNQIKSVQHMYEEALAKWSKVEDSNLNSNMLSPYRYMYFTKATGKKYVLPLLSESELLSTSNSFGDAANASGLFGFDFNDIAKNLMNTIAGASMVLDLFSDNSEVRGSTAVGETHTLEMAKSFNFNADGPTVKSNFILYNTIKKDAWKQNYRFLILFLLRNLPFKISPYSFIPPLLYDIIVPGSSHLPLCYVSSINVIPLGHMRHLTMPHFIKEIINDKTNNTTQMLVNVPEAWQVSISFKSILASTANLILDLANSNINISTTSISA